MVGAASENLFNNTSHPFPLNAHSHQTISAANLDVHRVCVCNHRTRKTLDPLESI